MTLRSPCRLVDHPGFRSQWFWKFQEARALKEHEAGGHFERPAGIRVGMDIPIEVGSGHGKDDRETGALESKATYRGKAAAGVKGNHQVTGLAAIRLLDLHAMAKSSEDSGPSKGGHPVSFS